MPCLLRRPAFAPSPRRRRQGAHPPRPRLRHPDGAQPRDGRTRDRLRSGIREPRGFARRVGGAVSGSSGQGCLGYCPRMSAPHRRPGAAPEPRQVARDLDRPLRRREQMQDERHASVRRASDAVSRPNSSCTRTARTGPSCAAIIDRDLRAGRHLQMGRRLAVEPRCRSQGTRARRGFAQPIGTDSERPALADEVGREPFPCRFGESGVGQGRAILRPRPGAGT